MSDETDECDYNPYVGFGGGEAPPTRVRSVFQKKPYHAVAVLAAVGVGPS